MSDRATVVTSGSTFDNRANLSPKLLALVERKYDGTRLGRQELYAELLEDMEGALWKRGVIDALRVKEHQLPPLERIVVAIDDALVWALTELMIEGGERRMLFG
jgi:phage terminase large subunit-like protein